MFTKELSGKPRDFSYTSCLQTGTTFLTIDLCHHSGTFVTMNKPTVTHHHPESVVYIKAHSRGCTFYGF